MQLTSVVQSYMESKVITIDRCKIPWVFQYQTSNPTVDTINDPATRSEAELRTMAALGVRW
jgi:hypothetical protein